MSRKRKQRVNISVDKELLDKAKLQLRLFGGKLSTLFNVYLSDFVESMSNAPAKSSTLLKKMSELEKRIKKLEEN